MFLLRIGLGTLNRPNHEQGEQAEEEGQIRPRGQAGDAERSTGLQEGNEELSNLESHLCMLILC